MIHSKDVTIGTLENQLAKLMERLSNAEQRLFELQDSFTEDGRSVRSSCDLEQSHSKAKGEAVESYFVKKGNYKSNLKGRRQSSGSSGSSGSRRFVNNRFASKDKYDDY